MLKWTLRIFGGLLALIVVVLGASVAMFEFWRADAIADLEDDPDRRVAETPLGEIEYAVLGEGIPFLALHGTPGGYDQSLSRLRALPDSANPDVMTIAVSRPGYLGTPLSSGKTYAEQADLFAALLDDLGVAQTIVFGASGGGHAAVQFALRHPDRTLGLILYAAETRTAPEGTPDPRDLPPMGPFRMHMLEYGMWLVSGPMASAVIHEYDASDPDQTTAWKAMLRTAVPWGARVAGQTNDAIQRLDPALDDVPVERITAPTLIMHGDADVNVPYADSVSLAERIPNAELVTFPGGDHFVMVTRSAEVQGHVRRFIEMLR